MQSYSARAALIELKMSWTRHILKIKVLKKKKKPSSKIVDVGFLALNLPTTKKEQGLNGLTEAKYGH